MEWQAVTCGLFYFLTLLTVLPGAGNAVPRASAPVNTRDVCLRDAPHTLASKSPGDNGFRIRLSGANPDQYIPEEVYTITINGTYSNQKLIGFILVAVPENAQDAAVSMGTFQHFSHGMTKFAEQCPNVVTHTYDHLKAGVDILWTAPHAGSGCITLRATVIEYSDIWYKDDGALTKVICQQDVDPSPSLPSQGLHQDCCACGAGKYQMTFKGLWSRQTHPKDWPKHKRLLHWSNIVGASHSKDYAIWQYGDYSSKGVKEVCEFGYTRTLEQEMRQHSRDVRTVVKTPGIWWSDPDGLRQTRWARFSVDRRNHLLTMLTMMGPSPDWCVGVTSLNLCLPNCTWAGDMTIDLYPWDAGTDDGAAYMSANQKSDPQQKIFRITNEFPSNPASPFYGPSPIPPLAQLIIHRINPKPGATTICYGNETDEIDSSFDSSQGPSHNSQEMPMELKKIIMMSSLSEMEKNKITMKGLTIAEKKKVVMMATGLTDMEKTKVTMILDSLDGSNNNSDNDDSNNMEMLKKAVMMSSLSEMEQEKIFMEGLTPMEREKIVMMSNIPQAEKDKLVMLIRASGEQQNQHQQGPGEAEMELKRVVMMTGLSESEKNTLLMGDLNDMEREKLVLMSSITQMEKDKLTMLIRQAAEERESIPKCAVTDWSDWSECSITCGVGERVRKRSFLHPMGTEAMCDSDSMQVENCIGVENTCETIQDECAMTAWSDWSPCSVTCGKGITERRRYYLRQEDATKCVRQTQDRRICSADIDDCEKAMSMKNFTAICALPKDVGPCRGHFERFYFDSEQAKCVKFAYGGCRGNNNRFSTFEECSEMCVFATAVVETETTENAETDNQKSKKRNRKRKNNRKRKQKNNGTDTENTENQNESQENTEGTFQRDNEIEKVSCQVSDWSTWSGCTATCGESFKFKRRTILIAPVGGGKKCPKKLEKKRKCKVPECPTDCVLGSWSDWSPCTKTCGYDSIQERSRQVIHNRRHDGSPCPARIERRYCQLPPCFDTV